MRLRGEYIYFLASSFRSILNLQVGHDSPLVAWLLLFGNNWDKVRLFILVILSILHLVDDEVFIGILICCVVIHYLLLFTFKIVQLRHLSMICRHFLLIALSFLLHICILQLFLLSVVMIGYFLLLHHIFLVHLIFIIKFSVLFILHFVVVVAV